jgi:shikimate kinase
MATELSSNNNIVFIGFMGCGKSTIGRKLAHESDNIYFLDTDHMIETYENRKISEIFESDSEKYFRDAENSTYHWISKNVNNAIISTGGGLPIYIDDISYLGEVIYLKLDFETIKARLCDEELKKRPLFADLDKAKELFEQRAKIYEDRASIVIDANDSVENIVIKIKSLDCYKKLIL